MKNHTQYPAKQKHIKELLEINLQQLEDCLSGLNHLYI